MKSKQIRRAMNRFYLVVGKTVVFTGAFSLMFYLLGLIFKFVEPLLLNIAKAVSSNMQWIVIGVFLTAITFNGVLKIQIRLAEKRHLSGIEFENVKR